MDCPWWTRGPLASSRTVRHSSTGRPQTSCTKTRWQNGSKERRSRTQTNTKTSRVVRHLADGPRLPRGRSTRCESAQPRNPRTNLQLAIDGSPKPQWVLRRNFREMMSTQKWRYAPKITASNSLQLPESQISCLYLKNTKNSKTTKIEGLPTGFEGQDHKEKRHTILMCEFQNKSRKETPPNPSHENPKKRLRKTPKKTNGRDTIKPWGTTPNHLYIPWRFIRGLACHPIIHPSLKISPWSSQASPRKS
jgi:hypothetical protein